MASKDPGPIMSLLTRAHSPGATNRIYNEKIQNRNLHLKPTAPSTNAQQARRIERQNALAQRKKKLKPAPLSARRKRALGLYNVPKEAQKYAIYKPLQTMWIGYIQEVLWDGRAGQDGSVGFIDSSGAAKLCSADYHGAELEVVRSRCVSRVGVKGIVVKDTRFVFEIVTEKDVIKVVPKEHTIFRFEVPLPGLEKQRKKGEEKIADEETEPRKNLVFELHGDQFMHRAADRAKRQFKPKSSLNI